MILNDEEIRQLAVENQMIDPYCKNLVRQIGERKVLSYGQSSYGYDIRLSPDKFLIFRRLPGRVMDPKNFDAECLVSTELYSDTFGKYFILPAHSYGLGFAYEKLQIPRDVTVLCLGKSTYARMGVIANCTPVEAGWTGYLTIEFSNSSDADCRVYAEEGIIQLLFFKGNPCKVSYADRKGKYQNQAQEVTLPRV